MLTLHPTQPFVKQVDLSTLLTICTVLRPTSAAGILFFSPQRGAIPGGHPTPNATERPVDSANWKRGWAIFSHQSHSPTETPYDLSLEVMLELEDARFLFL